MIDITIAADKPLRRDAARNRERILAAARELFGERGLGVSLNDIAHHAGVGVATVYRHFPDKDRLVEGLFDAQFDELVTLGETALADPDPWHGLVTWMTAALEMQIFNRALKDLLHSSENAVQRIGRIRERLLPMGQEVVRRAHATGQLRPDIAATDMPIVQMLIATAFDGLPDDVDPELWRRYVGILLRGLSALPDEQPPLPVPAPGPELVDRIMSSAKLRRR